MRFRHRQLEALSVSNGDADVPNARQWSLASYRMVRNAVGKEMTTGLHRSGRSAISLANEILEANGKPQESNHRQAYAALSQLIQEKEGVTAQ